jgi:hypothetical protein
MDHSQHTGPMRSRPCTGSTSGSARLWIVDALENSDSRDRPSRAQGSRLWLARLATCTVRSTMTLSTTLVREGVTDLPSSDDDRVLGLSPRSRRVVVPVMLVTAVLLLLTVWSSRGSDATPAQGAPAITTTHALAGRL